MQLDFLFHLGYGQGFGVDRAAWRNQHGFGAKFGIRVEFFRVQFKITFAG